ncbi:MAG: copper resistance protein CopC [Actinomycetia bacterium]|nr:copper resistance protein CopC [Actinomycetes bacterium]
MATARPKNMMPPAGRVISVVAIVGIVLGLVFPSPAPAHTTMLQASPGPGQRAGGMIEFVDLVFAESISDGVVTVTLDGVVIPGSMIETEGQIIRFGFDEPLTEPGRYEVAYEFLSFDLDPGEATYVFDFVPEALQPVRLGLLDEPESRSWVPVVAGVILVGCLAGLAFLFLGRIKVGRGIDEDDPDADPPPR